MRQPIVSKFLEGQGELGAQVLKYKSQETMAKILHDVEDCGGSIQLAAHLRKCTGDGPQSMTPRKENKNVLPSME